MILPLIMAIWFGLVARKAGRRWYVWALIGAAITFVVANAVSYMGNVLFGPFSLDSVVTFTIISAVVSIGMVLAVGAVIVATLKKQPG
jgi:hypothetical protein